MNDKMTEKAKKIVSAPGFRWMPGMKVRRGSSAYTVVSVQGPDPFAGILEAEPVIYPENPAIIGGGYPHASHADPGTVILDLDAPATRGCLLALVRERHGTGSAVARVGVMLTGGAGAISTVGEWAIVSRAQMVGGCWQACVPLYGFPSEVDALACGLGVVP